jgi:transposase-like protein
MDRIAAGEAVAEVARTFGINRATMYRLRPSTPEYGVGGPSHAG